MKPAALEALIAAEIDRPAASAAQALATEILRLHDGSVAAILFYGSCRRTGDLSGLLDLYVLHDGHRKFHGRGLAALLNWILPPNVLLVTTHHDGRVIRAKVAVMSRRQFGRRMRSRSLDTTVWARFAQPSSLLYSRDEATRRHIVVTLAQGVRTAAFWALKLGPPSGTPAECWPALFARTYGAELRPERGNRPEEIYRSNLLWFNQALAGALIESQDHGPADRRGLTLSLGANWGRSLAWLPRRLLGKPMNLLRLAKAAFTFHNAAAYVVWKVERHSGVRLALTNWQRRHPILAAPCLLWRLWRIGAVR